MIRVGIDVGGTNTDAVLLDGTAVLHAAKAGTTADVTSGILAALLQDASSERVTTLSVGFRDLPGAEDESARAQANACATRLTDGMSKRAAWRSISASSRSRCTGATGPRRMCPVS